LLSISQARAERRVLFSAGLVGAGVGLALGAVYMMGGMGQVAAAHARAERLSLAAASGLPGGAPDPAFLRLSDQLRPAQAADGSPESVAQQKQRDLDCLTDAVYFEARGETVKGQAAVATVVMNRVKKPGFPKSVCGVVFQRAPGHGCQFSFACDGSMRMAREDDAWDRARGVASHALAGVLLRDVGSATHFHAENVTPDWGDSMLRVAQVGLHIFYRPNPHAKAPAEDLVEPVPVQQASFTPAKDAQPTLKLASQTETAPSAPAPEKAQPKAQAPDAAKAAAPAAAKEPAKVADSTAS
jgi:hypothetical protein